MMDAEEVPDATLSELEDSDDEAWQEFHERMRDDMDDVMQDRMESMACLGTAIGLAKMVEDDHITMREYWELSDYLEEWNRSLDESPL